MPICQPASRSGFLSWRLLNDLVDIQFERNDIGLSTGKIPNSWDVVEIFSQRVMNMPSGWSFGDEIELWGWTLTGSSPGEVDHLHFSATTSQTNDDHMEVAIFSRAELEEQLKVFKKEGKLLSPSRLMAENSLHLFLDFFPDFLLWSMKVTDHGTDWGM